MIKIDAITFSFPDQLQIIFQNFSWQIDRNETYTVLGPSGCGKTTLLYLLAGLQKPNHGKIFILDEEINRPRPETGLILQDYGLLPWATVEENVSLGLRVRQFYGPDGTHAPKEFVNLTDQKEMVSSWLEKLNILDQAKKYPSQLSGGQRQRVAIARTLILEPDLLLMDEPFSSLDAPTRENLHHITLKLCEERGITLIVVTHSVEEAVYLGKKILVLDEPPNKVPNIINNSSAGSESFRNSVAYTKLVEGLRKVIGKTQNE